MTLSKTRKDFATEEEYQKYREKRNKSEVLRRGKIRPEINKQEKERLDAHPEERVKKNRREVERRGKIRPEVRQASRKEKTQMKNKVMSHYSYGEIHCIHCGETNIDFLTIDHINGKKAWKGTGGYSKAHDLTRWLIREDFPEGFQVLCWNWNQIKTKKENEIKRKSTPKAEHARSRELNNKIQTLTKYSEGDKPQCCCCKYDELDGLTIHHKYGRKNAPIEEQELYGDKIYRFLRDKGYPKGHHLTWCFNCNSAASEEGICPHQNMRKNN